MCNKGMRPRHWAQMSEIAGFDLTPDHGSTLRKMLKLNLEPFMDQFETISAAASKVIKVSILMAFCQVCCFFRSRVLNLPLFCPSNPHVEMGIYV